MAVGGWWSAITHLSHTAHRPVYPPVYPLPLLYPSRHAPHVTPHTSRAARAPFAVTPSGSGRSVPGAPEAIYHGGTRGAVISLMAAPVSGSDGAARLHLGAPESPPPGQTRQKWRSGRRGVFVAPQWPRANYLMQINIDFGVKAL